MRYELWSLIGPLSWPLWSLVLAAVLTLFRRRGARAAVAVAGLLLLLMSSPRIGHWLITPLEMRYPRPAFTQAPDVLIVLAGGERLAQSAVFGRPQFTDASERIGEAAYLARRFPAAQLVLVGGLSWQGRVSDVGIGAQFLREVGVAPARIALVANTTDTCSNASGFAALAKPRQQLVLITSAAHMPRAMACFARFGMSPLPYPVDYRGLGGQGGAALFAPNFATTASTIDLAAHEWIGLAWYRLTGRTQQLLP